MQVFSKNKQKKNKPFQSCVLGIAYNYEGCSTVDTGNAVANALTFIKIDVDR